MNDIAADHVGPMLNPPTLVELIRESIDEVGWNVAEATGRCGKGVPPRPNPSPRLN